MAVMLFSASGAAAYGTGDVRYENKTQLTDTLTYTNRISVSGSGRVESFELELSPNGDVEQIVSSCDTVYGGMTVQDVVRYVEGQGYNVLAAVNSDFYSTTNRIPLGIVIENGIYKSSPAGANALCIDAEGQTSVSESPSVLMTLFNNGGGVSAANYGQTVTIDHFNKLRSDTGLYMYSSDFSTVSTRTSTDGWYVRFAVLSGELGVNSALQLRVEELINDATEVQIGEGYMVLTAAAVAGFEAEFAKFAVGDTVTLTTSCEDAAVSSARWACGGGDVLVKDGAITEDDIWDKAIAAANPRTAVGIKADGTVLYRVIDGRRASYSRGATFLELAEEMLAQGCVTVMNLDGGGSSVMSVRTPGNTSCTVVNSPSDGSARRCGAYVLFVSRNESDGQVRRLFLKNSGAIVLSGSSVTLEPAASDSAHRKVEVPSDITMNAVYGSVNGGVYTAPESGVVDTVTLYSKSTGARGEASIYVVAEPDTVEVSRDDGKAVTSLNLGRNETVMLKASAKYLSRPIITDEDGFVFTVNGDIGEFSEDGAFTAGAHSNVSGTITVTAGKKTASIDVSIPPELEDIDGHWSEVYIRELYGAGIVNGITATSFEPDSMIRRGDFILMLYRAAGSPEIDIPSTFTDVPADAYFSKAVAWAEINGIAKGTDTGTFNPGDSLMREQGFTFVYRYLTFIGEVNEETPVADISTFTDAESVSEYAVTPVSVLVALDIVGGSGGMLSSQDSMTRGQMAKVLSSAI